MSLPLRIWIEISHHAAFQVGGWAYVRTDGQEISGRAGGDRRIGPERTALAGLVAALDGTPADAPLTLIAASPLIRAIPARLAATGEDAPADDLDLWARAMTLLKERSVRMQPGDAAPRTPTAFAAGWAELARDKAKSGPFAAAIPKPNLAKAGA